MHWLSGVKTTSASFRHSSNPDTLTKHQVSFKHKLWPREKPAKGCSSCTMHRIELVTRFSNARCTLKMPIQTLVCPWSFSHISRTNIVTFPGAKLVEWKLSVKCIAWAQERHGIVATSNKIVGTNDGMLSVYNLRFIAKSNGQTPAKFPGVD